MDCIRRCRKPVVIVKGGKSESGSRATSSHTGSLAGSYEIYKTALKQAGAYFIDNLTDALILTKFLSIQKKPANFRTVIITNAGGSGILISDNLEGNGIKVAKLPRIRFDLPPAWSHNNPIDVLGDADDLRFKEVFSRIKKKNFYDILVVVLTPQEMTDDVKIASQVVNFYKSSGKTVIACFTGFKSFSESREILERNNIPCFNNLEDVGRLLGNLKNK